MKPYYEDEWVTIYLGDCREILPSLGKNNCPRCHGEGWYLHPVLGGDYEKALCQHPEIDLVLTDPPYGINYHSGYYKYGNPHGSIIGDSSYPVDVLQTCLLLATKAVFSFARWDLIYGLPKPKSVIAWLKNNWTAGDLAHAYGRQWEAVLFYPQREHQFINRPSDVIDLRRIPSSELKHPTEKPVAGIQKLLQPNEGKLVLDPFMGSGTTLVAAKALNRKAIGIEIEEKYCEIAAKRCSQSVMVLDIG